MKTSVLHCSVKLTSYSIGFCKPNCKAFQMVKIHTTLHTCTVLKINMSRKHKQKHNNNTELINNNKSCPNLGR